MGRIYGRTLWLGYKSFDRNWWLGPQSTSHCGIVIMTASTWCLFHENRWAHSRNTSCWDKLLRIWHGQLVWDHSFLSRFPNHRKSIIEKGNPRRHKWAISGEHDATEPRLTRHRRRSNLNEKVRLTRRGQTTSILSCSLLASDARKYFCAVGPRGLYVSSWCVLHLFFKVTKSIGCASPIASSFLFWFCGTCRGWPKSTLLYHSATPTK